MCFSENIIIKIYNQPIFSMVNSCAYRFLVDVFRAVAPGVLDKDLFRIQTLQHIMKMTRTWDSTMSMIPKGGDTIWGGLDWSPEQGYAASKRKHNTSQPEDLTCTEDGNVKQKVKYAHYGRIISFGKDVAEAHSSEIQRIDFRVTFLAFFSGTLQCHARL